MQWPFLQNKNISFKKREDPNNLSKANYVCRYNQIGHHRLSHI